MNAKVNLPYFDVILEDKEKEEAALKDSLHMHWGYWEDPTHANPRDRADFHQAAERLCRMIAQQVDIEKGDRLADIGCGFGGTIHSLNQTYDHVHMIGLNIDPRQIEVARSRVTANNGNTIEFITGNACDLPFEDASIDALLAVECIFHFPDREKFFAEVTRVLKPGGKFAISDFVPLKEMQGRGRLIRQFFRKCVSIHFGGGSETLTLSQYDEMARRHGLKIISKIDVTSKILPTFVTLFDRIDWNHKGSLINWFSTKMLELSQKSGKVRYMILGFQKV